MSLLEPECCFLHLLVSAGQPFVFSDLAPGLSGSGHASCDFVRTWTLSCEGSRFRSFD